MSGPAAPPDGEESAASGPCPDCRTSFPYLKAGSKCGKCELLNGLSRNSDEYAKIMVGISYFFLILKHILTME